MLDRLLAIASNKPERRDIPSSHGVFLSFMRHPRYHHPASCTAKHIEENASRLRGEEFRTKLV